MRNLILMHLESLNYVNYRTNRELFPNLLKWEENSLSFSHYFSTATSTLMVLADLVYGGMLQYEVCDSLDAVPEKYCYKASLFDWLKNMGYITKVLYFPSGGDCESAEKRHVVGFRSEMVSLQEYERYVSEIESTIDSENPFALMLCNTVSNIALNYYVPNGKFESGLDRWKQGYKFMDACVGEITDLLESKSLMNNTTVIFYGDHGDDYYGHGNHRGLTHAIEPYASLIHTPFWIYDSRLRDRGNCNDLLSTVDIRFIAERLLEISKNTFTWNALEISKRTFAIARNAYAAQPVRKDSFNKGYCITDGKFLLLVSSNGLEFYDIEMDVQCQNNLLKFFLYENGLLRINEKLNGQLSYHYKFLMNMSTVRQIRQKFYFLKKKLYDSVTELYQYADCQEHIDELNFEWIHNE